jgi:hypothetical protein
MTKRNIQSIDLPSSVASGTQLLIAGAPINIGDARRITSSAGLSSYYIARWNQPSGMTDVTFTATHWMVYPGDNGPVDWASLPIGITVNPGVIGIKSNVLYECSVADTIASTFDVNNWVLLSSDWQSSIVTATKYASGGPINPLQYYWTPPAQSSPTVITVTSTTANITGTYTANQDVLIDCTGLTSPRTGTISTTGGRIVKVLGGEHHNSFSIKQVTQAIVIEGCFIDMSTVPQHDAMNLCGSSTGPLQPDIYLLGVRVSGTQGSFSTTHADMYQPQGPISNVYVDLFSGFGNYQGLFLNPQYNVNGAFLRRVNLDGYDDGDGNGKTSAYLLWLSYSYGKLFPTYLDQVYVGPSSGGPLTQYVWPAPGTALLNVPSGASINVGAIASADGLSLSFPNSTPYYGKVQLGPPSTGDFVPLPPSSGGTGNVGIGYVAPGSVSPAGPAGPAGPTGSTGGQGAAGPTGPAGGSDASALGLCYTINPKLVGTTSAALGTTKTGFMRVSGTKTGAVQFRAYVNTSSGNVSLAAYANNGSTGRAAAPTGAALTTTGSVACPAAGIAVFTPTTTPFNVAEGAWVALATDNSTVKFSSSGAAPDPTMVTGLLAAQGTYPAPSTVGTLGTLSTTYYLSVE